MQNTSVRKIMHNNTKCAQRQRIRINKIGRGYKSKALKNS